MDLSTLLRAIQSLGPVASALPAFKELYDQAAATLSKADQKTAKEAYAEFVAENDAGHVRLQEKLAAAAKR